MGSESQCHLRIGREQYKGTARLEAEHIDFSGPTKFRFRFSEIRSPGRAGGDLTFNFHGHSVRLGLGERSEKWLESILHPKTLEEKLGVKPGHLVRLVNFDDRDLCARIEERKGRIAGREARGPVNLILFSVERPAELNQLKSMAREIEPDGAIWVIIPKANKNITQANVMAAARESGLVDVKVCSFSDTQSGYRLVIPVSQRTAVAKPPATRPTKTAAAAAKTAVARKKPSVNGSHARRKPR